MLRSLLFVPTKEKMLNKIASLDSDGYIIDLEDSINEEDKSDALELLCSFLSEHEEWSNIYVRLNKTRFEEEAVALNGFRVGFMLPKFEASEDYSCVDCIWRQHELIALVETPMGVINIQNISQCPWVDAIAFGAEDFTASVNMLNEDSLLLPVKSSLIVGAKAYGKKIYDTPSFKINDEKAFEQEVLNSVSLGFDGKLLINPKQIEFVNKSFVDADLDHIAYIISEYEKRGEAVVVIDGKVYEKMHINRFYRILKEHNQ